MKTVGQVAYEAWRAKRTATYCGIYTPQWNDEMTEEYKEPWEAAGLAAIEYFLHPEHFDDGSK
jgi:hypothetical protein